MVLSHQLTLTLTPPHAAGAAFLHDLGLGAELSAISNPATHWVMRTTSGWPLTSLSANAKLQVGGTVSACLLRPRRFPAPGASPYPSFCRPQPPEFLRDGRPCFCFVLRTELRDMLARTLPKARHPTPPLMTPAPPQKRSQQAWLRTSSPDSPASTAWLRASCLTRVAFLPPSPANLALSPISLSPKGRVPQAGRLRVRCTRG